MLNPPWPVKEFYPVLGSCVEPGRGVLESLVALHGALSMGIPSRAKGITGEGEEEPGTLFPMICLPTG